MALGGTPGNLLITILIVADLAVCAVVLLYLFWGDRRPERQVDMGRLRRLVDSLSALVKESDRASKSLLDALNERHRRTEELFEQLDKREKRMAEAIREAERTILKEENSDISGKYGEVSRLADLGLGAGEIAARVELPKGEIDLILGLKR